MKNYLLFLLCLVFFSCANEKKEEKEDLKPEAVLPADSVIPPLIMVQLLADVHIVEAGLQIQKNHGVDIKTPGRKYYYGIFQKYHISQKRYDLNLEYYRQDPDAFEKFYELVQQEVTRRQESLPKGKPVHKRE